MEFNQFGNVLKVEVIVQVRLYQSAVAVNVVTTCILNFLYQQIVVLIFPFECEDEVLRELEVVSDTYMCLLHCGPSNKERAFTF
jgi:hypothetical protein